eukprot:4079643-Pleurochrysis_carterae.AAC.1
MDAMGTSPHAVHSELTWLLGIDNKGALLSATHLAILRIFWRHVYAAMVCVKYDGDTFLPNLGTQSIARTFYSRILAFQHARLLCFFGRRFSYHGNYKLPESEATRFAPIGNLRLTDGSLTVKQRIIYLLQQQNISCEHLNAHSSIPSPSPRRSGNNNRDSNNNNNSTNSNKSSNNNSNINISPKWGSNGHLCGAALSTTTLRLPVST